MGFVIVAVMAVGVLLMLTRLLPTAFTLGFLAVAIALLSGASLLGKTDSVATTVLQTGAPLLAATMIAILLGSWLGALLEETGIAATLVRKIVEFGGERPSLVALGVFGVSLLVGTITGSAPAALLAGVVGIPAMIAVGVPKVVAAGTVLMGISAGLPLELIGWQFLADALRMPIEQVRSFQLRLFPIVLVIGIAYVLIETRRKGVRHAWAVRASASRRARRGDAPWYALLTPLVPIVLALGFDLPIVPALLAGLLYCLVSTYRRGGAKERALRTLYRAFEVAAPPIVLFVAIGMLLSAVRLPGAVAALNPIVQAVSPAGPVLFVLVFAVLAPLSLYRGPLNIYGLGAGVAGVLISGGVYPQTAVLGLMSSLGQVLGVSDPTSTQTVWSAQYAGTRPERVMLSTLPYTWLIALGGLTLTALLYL
ncbi:TRAP transporter large permease subunit [Crossiella cryophila]|uniref:TRAP-type mannitol/chloroaromatic compound transport system permease large subunit n=1 Tax=Crossiella cryophila TaxID=43355 RepID=A0A7W7FVZ0_9PSEU|nr:TRAP transporter large permease subunit [Crossiella cryophila]MBB4679043.1 TRAP-type mannitol/chloroaromatic compound transport system permease large subunit [Crossiella cryophila]